MSDKRAVTVHLVADRHADPHDREFAETHVVTVPTPRLGDAVSTALTELGLSDTGGKCVITVDWPHA